MVGEHEKPGSGRYSEVEFKWAMSHVVFCLIGLGDLWPGGFWALEVLALGIFGLGNSGLRILALGFLTFEKE